MRRKPVVVCISVLALIVLLTATAGADTERPYVIAFTFQGGYDFGNLMPEEQLRVFNEGAFDGWGLTYVWRYKTDPGPSPEELAPTVAWLKEHLAAGKHIWPVVYLSRIIQPTPDHLGKSTRFDRIPGMDLDNEAGVRAIFEQEWRNACLVAKELGSPGILLDPEWYGNSAVRYPTELAQMRNEDVATTIAKCRAFGARLADITEEVYPDCHIVTLYTGLSERPANWTTVAYIHLGIIERAKELGSRQVLIDGGELGLGYLHTSIAALQERIFNRWIETRDLLKKYPNYQLGGVLAPYVDRDERVPWMSDHRIGPEQTAEDFVPHFRELFRNYKFIWLYGAGSGDAISFNPWDAQHSAAMSAALERAQRTSYYCPPDLNALPDEKVPEGDRGWTAARLVHLPREVLVDWANPGETKIIRKYYRGQGGVPEAATITTGPYSAGGKEWQAEVQFDKSLLNKWPWPGISATNLPVADLSAYQAIWIEVYNASQKPIQIRFSVFLSGGKVLVADSYAGYASGENIAPSESRVLFCENINEPVEAVALGAVSQPDEQMSIYVSPVYLAKRAGQP